MLIIFIQLNLFKHMIKNEYKDFSKNDIRKYFLENIFKEFITGHWPQSGGLFEALKADAQRP